MFSHIISFDSIQSSHMNHPIASTEREQYIRHVSRTVFIPYENKFTNCSDFFQLESRVYTSTWRSIERIQYEIYNEKHVRWLWVFVCIFHVALWFPSVWQKQNSENQIFTLINDSFCRSFIPPLLFLWLCTIVSVSSSHIHQISSQRWNKCDDGHEIAKFTRFLCSIWKTRACFS